MVIPRFSAWHRMEYEADSSRLQATMAGEMLKTPSRRKAVADRLCPNSTQAKKKRGYGLDADLFFDAEDKENTSAQSLDLGRESMGATRSTRSRGDTAQVVKLPNPFQAKLIKKQSKRVGDRAVREPGEEVSSARIDVTKGAGEPVREPSLIKAVVGLNKTLQTECRPDITPAPNSEPTQTNLHREQKVSWQDRTPASKHKFSDEEPTKAVTTSSGSKQETHSSPSSTKQEDHEFDQSIEPDGSLGNALMSLGGPKASTPTSNRSSMSNLPQPILSGQILAPIIDAVDSEEEAPADFIAFPLSSFTGPGVSQSVDDGTRCPQVGEKTQIGEASHHSIRNISSHSQSSLPECGTEALPRQKRTLASFGGAKKSASVSVHQGIAASSTPAATGFKSTFLKKSLRQASIRKEGGEDEANGLDSVFDSASTKANTQANAAARAEISVDHKGETETTKLAKRFLGLKRKSDETEELRRQSKKRMSSVRPPMEGEDDSSESVRKAVSHAVPVSKTASGPPANLLRSKLETARLQKSTNLGSVGLGLRGLTSPVLCPTGCGSMPTSPDLVSSKSKLQNRFVQSGAQLSSVSVAQLLNTWEARNSSAQSSPQRSNAPPSPLPVRSSPSKLPVPASTTPQSSPARKQLYAPPKTSLSSKPAITGAVSPRHVGKTQQEQSAALTKSDEGEAHLATATSHKEEDLSVSEDIAVTASFTGKFEEFPGAGTSPQRKAEIETVRKRDEASVDKNDIRRSDDVDKIREASDEIQDKDKYHSQNNITGGDPNTNPDGPVVQEDPVEQSLDLRNVLPDVTDDATSPLHDVDDASDDIDSLRGVKKSPSFVAASAATQALPAHKTNNFLVAANADTAPNACSGMTVGGAGWSSRLKGLFGIAGMPCVVNAGPPAPGSGFQPKLSRSVSSAVRDIHTAGTLQQTVSGIYRRNIADSKNIAKPASVIRAEQTRRREAEELERRARERDEKRKQMTKNDTAVTLQGPPAVVNQATTTGTDQKKRVRDDEEPVTASQRSGATSAASGRSQTTSGYLAVAPISSQPRARIMSQVSTAANSAVASTKSMRTLGQAHAEEGGKKRRLSQEKEGSVRSTTGPLPSSAIGPGVRAGTTKASTKGLVVKKGVRNAAGNTAAGVNRAAKATPLSTPASQPRSAVVAPSSSNTASKAAAMQQAANFTQQNPFQQARTVASTNQQPRPPPNVPQFRHATTALSASVLSTVAAPPPGSIQPNAEDDNVSLPSIASEYSDSEDEETQARRARAADWTKGDALQMALRAQSNMDADLIFGVPTGQVDLNTLMPPQDPVARARILRPRTSSANWNGADGLAQWEIDRYNQRMNINGPGFKLPARAASTLSRDRLGNSDQDHRSSVLALGAAAAARHQGRQP